MGTHPIFESDFDCLTVRMVRVSELPIYDRPDWKRPVPKPTPVTNIELVVTSTLNDYVISPTRGFFRNRLADGQALFEHLQTTTGIAQVVTIGGSVFIGRKLAQRLLPMVKGREYTIPFKSAHNSFAYAAPLATTCFWFDTPREYTIWALTNGAKYSAQGLYLAVTWTGWLAWKSVAFVFGCIWGFIRFFIWDIPTGILNGSYNGGAYVVNKYLASKSEKISEPEKIPDASSEAIPENSDDVTAEIVEKIEEISERNDEKLEELAEVIEEVAENVAETVEILSEKIENVSTSEINLSEPETLVETASKIAEETFETVTETVETIVEDAIETVEKVADDVKETVENYAEKVIENVTETAETVTIETLETITDTVETVTDDVIEKVENLTEEAKETITETASEFIQTAPQTAETIVENIAETVIDTVGELVTEPEGEKTEIPVADISEPINPSKVEEELKSLNRHWEDEILLMVQKSEKEKSSILDLTEDLGQSEEDDKELFPDRPR